MKMTNLKKLTLKRYILSYLGFLCSLVVYFGRTNLSIAIVAMTESKNDTLLLNMTAEPSADFIWSTSEKTNLLASYFYGYISTQIIGAWISSKYGFKWILFTTTLIASILTIVTPFLADLGKGWILASRILIGKVKQ